MTTKTKVIWTTPLAQQTLDDCKTQVYNMIAAGQTDGVPEIIHDSPVAGQETVFRNWTDTAAAQEWIDFLQPYGPLSAQIVV
jgi:hypothetical protein